MTKVLLIGSGITSAITSNILRKELPYMDLTVYEKNNTIGGRMATIRSESIKNCSVDTGYQYLTTTEFYNKKHNFYYEELKAKNLLTAFSGSIEGFISSSDDLQHYVTPQGAVSLVKHFFTGCLPRCRHHVTKILENDSKWEVFSIGNKAHIFDAVVLIMPVPQILKLSGTISNIIEQNEPLKRNLEKVVYSSRFALSLFFNGNVTLPNGHCAQYVKDDPVIRYVSVNNQKRAKGNIEGPTSVIVHTSIAYGKQNIDKNMHEVEQILMAKIRSMFPSWPKPNQIQCDKWEFSQVLTPYADSPGAVSLSDGLIAGGDGFSSSNLNGCIDSAEAISKLVVDFVGSKKSTSTNMES